MDVANVLNIIYSDDRHRAQTSQKPIHSNFLAAALLAKGHCKFH